MTRSRSGRAIRESANRDAAGEDLTQDDSVLNATFQGESVNGPPPASNRIGDYGSLFDLTQMQNMIGNCVSASISSLTSQLPGLINSCIDNRLRDRLGSQSASNIASGPLEDNFVQTSPVVQNRDFNISSPMVKWNIKFTGNSGGMSVNDFIFRVETLRGRQNLSWTYVCDNFHLLLAEKADEWYWLYLGRNGSPSWPSIKSAITKEFKHRDTDFEILKSIMDYKQSNEPFDDFFFKVVKVNGQMDQPLTDDKLLEILKGNLNFRLWQLTFSARIQTLEELRDHCRNAERQLMMRQSVKPRVNEIDSCIRDGEIVVEELRRDSVDRQVSCWNCDQQGHIFKACPSMQRRLFCYKCGQRNVTTRSCVKCGKISLNRQANSLSPDQGCSMSNPGRQ